MKMLDFKGFKIVIDKNYLVGDFYHTILNS
ncbi:hypothetical protein SAMN05880574_10322 [Chryseobacterium sp. RU37D]|nr:hypothetical protein SAMN05880574_10322 [Chryseobacterium sp. RU37D]